jgi:Flp pilus assembly protein TadG
MLESALITFALLCSALGAGTYITSAVMGQAPPWWAAVILIAGGPALIGVTCFVVVHWPWASWNAPLPAFSTDSADATDGEEGARCTAAEDGSLTLELAVLAPALMALVGLMVVFGRVELAHGSIEAAARSAARAASLARTATVAGPAARQAAHGSLARQGLHCTTLTVDVDTTGFAAPPASPATVHAQVSCQVALADVALPGLPGTNTLQASFDSPLDPYRAVSPEFTILDETSESANPAAGGGR